MNTARMIFLHLSLVLALGWVPAVMACGACWLPGGGLDVMHPMSINVAVATGTACREGRLPSDLKFEAEGADQLRRWNRVEEFARRIAGAHSGEGAVSMHLICVDSSLRTYFLLDGGRAEELPPSTRTSEFTPDLTVVTSEAALLTLLTGLMPFESAVQGGLIHAEDRDAVAVEYPKDPFAPVVASKSPGSGTSFVPIAMVTVGLALPIALAVLPRMKRRNRNVQRTAPA